MNQYRLVLVLTVFVGCGVGALRWQSLADKPGIDFLYYWGIAHSRPYVPSQVTNPYRYLPQYQSAVHTLAANSNDPALKRAVALRGNLDLTNTPLIYALAGLTSTQYTAALRMHRLLLALSFLVAMVGIAQVYRCTPTLTIVLAVGAAVLCGPLLLDLEVGNIASLQLLCLVISIGLTMRAPANSPAAFTNAFFLPLLALIKPNIALVLVTLWAMNIRALPSRLRLPAIGFSAASLAGGLKIPMWYFASPIIWLDWCRVLFGHERRLAYDYLLGNYSLASWWADALHTPPWEMTVLLLLTTWLATICVPIYASRGRIGTRALLPLAARADYWTSSAIILTLASSPLVWPHYLVLSVIPIAYLCGDHPRYSTPWWCGVLGACLTFGIVSIAASDILGNASVLVRAVNCLCWLPLAAGLATAQYTSSRSLKIVARNY